MTQVLVIWVTPSPTCGSQRDSGEYNVQGLSEEVSREGPTSSEDTVWPCTLNKVLKAMVYTIYQGVWYPIPCFVVSKEHSQGVTT